MRSATSSRSEVNRAIRSTFVRHFIDLGCLSIQNSANAISIHGSLKRLPGVAEELTPAMVEAMFTEINRIPGIRRINVQFDNWYRTGGGVGVWKAAERTAAPMIVIADQGTPPTWNLETEEKPKPPPP